MYPGLKRRPDTADRLTFQGAPAKTRGAARVEMACQDKNIGSRDVVKLSHFTPVMTVYGMQVIIVQSIPGLSPPIIRF